MLYNQETGIYFDISRMYDIDNGKRFKIIVRIPMSLGWIDDVCFVVWKGMSYNIEHKENTLGMACFESEVELKNCTMYGFYFSYRANGDFRYLKKENLTSNSPVIFEECWKMSVDSWSPEWIKGRIMCHVLATKNYNMTDKNSFDKKILLYQDNYKWYIRFMGKNMSLETFLGDLKLRRVSLVYVTHIDKNQIDSENSFAEMDDILRTMCITAHKWGICVILNRPIEHQYLLSGLNHLYGLGVDIIDTKGQFSSLMSATTELMWQ